ncbi:MAG: ABC transporter ATP-binding protein [Desulfosarcinaceae bacterium]|nr:ABC transporter ATP-binding protein [Desulfosarcinaceae bacterium]
MSGTSLKISLEKVSKLFGKVCAINTVDIEFAPGALTTLLGPSGCGKTTLLRLVSGLEPATSGRIWFGDEEVTHLSATRRDVGMVFQSYALFPHMTVAQNVGYGLKILNAAAADIAARVKEALEMVAMDGFQRRFPNELSGGQQQRVAVARAMVLRPKVLLFDEPLSNIDSKLRRSMREDIRRLQQASGITAIYVTHDQAEALAVSDEIIIMRQGAIEQKGPPQSLYHRPATAFVANFIGESNVVAAELGGQSGERWLAIGETYLDVSHRADLPVENGPVQLSLRPEFIEIVSKEAADESRRTALAGTIVQSAYMGAVYEYAIQTPVGRIFTRAPATGTRFQRHQPVDLRIQPDEVIVIPESVPDSPAA